MTVNGIKTYVTASDVTGKLHTIIKDETRPRSSRWVRTLGEDRRHAETYPTLGEAKVELAIILRAIEENIAYSEAKYAEAAAVRAAIEAGDELVGKRVTIEDLPEVWVVQSYNSADGTVRAEIEDPDRHLSATFKAADARVVDEQVVEAEIVDERVEIAQDRAAKRVDLANRGLLVGKVVVWDQGDTYQIHSIMLGERGNEATIILTDKHGEHAGNAWASDVRLATMEERNAFRFVAPTAPHIADGVEEPVQITTIETSIVKPKVNLDLLRAEQEEHRKEVQAHDESEALLVEAILESSRLGYLFTIEGKEGTWYLETVRPVGGGWIVDLRPSLAEGSGRIAAPLLDVRVAQPHPDDAKLGISEEYRAALVEEFGERPVTEGRTALEQVLESEVEIVTAEPEAGPHADELAAELLAVDIAEDLEAGRITPADLPDPLAYSDVEVDSILSGAEEDARRVVEQADADPLALAVDRIEIMLHMAEDAANEQARLAGLAQDADDQEMCRSHRELEGFERRRMAGAVEALKLIKLGLAAEQDEQQRQQAEEEEARQHYLRDAREEIAHALRKEAYPAQILTLDDGRVAILMQSGSLERYLVFVESAD